jgi:hypothetical protein
MFQACRIPYEAPATEEQGYVSKSEDIIELDSNHVNNAAAGTEKRDGQLTIEDIEAAVAEVVLVPGRSTDGTVALARRLWPSVVTIRPQPWPRASLARQG